MAPHEVRQANTDQVLPTWLTYSPIPLPSGGTSYTILRLPLTYYGPSIPLGTDGTWTYGGLSSPAPSPTATATTATSSPPPVTTSPPVTSSSTSALPSSTSSSSSSTSSASSSSTSSTSRPATTSFATPITSRTPTLTSSSPSSTSTSPIGAHASRLPAVAIILIALGAAAAVLLCCLIAALLWRRRKARRREPLRGDSEFYAGPGPDDEGSAESLHDVPGFTGERRSLLGNDSFVVLGTRPPPMAQRSIGGVSYQRLNDSQVSRHSSRRTGSDEIGVAYTEMPPPRTRRRTITAVSQPQSSSPSHPTSSSQRAFGSMRNGSQRSSLFEHPAEEDESPVLPRDSSNGVVRRASDLNQRPIQAPAPAASSPFAPGATLGTELGMLGLGTRYPDVSQSLLATSSSGGSMPPRLVVPTPSSLGSRSRSGIDYSRPPSQMFAGSNTGSRASRGHSPTPSFPPSSPPARDTLSWPDSPESEHDESAQLLTAERGNVTSGIGLLGRFSWFAGGRGRPSTPPRTSRVSYPGWMSPPTEEGFLAEGDSQYEAGPSASDPPTLESKPPVSHPGMVRLVSSRDREAPPTPARTDSGARPVSSVSGQSVYHDAPSQPATPRSPISTWLGFLGRSSPASGPAPPVPTRPSPLSHGSSSTPLPGPSASRTITPPEPARTRGSSDSEVDPASRLMRDEAQPPTDPSEPGDILDAPAPESLLEVTPPTVPPSPATPASVSAPVFPPGLLRLPRTWNFGLLNELGDEPPAAEERWAHLRSSPDVNWNLRRLSLSQAVRINSPHAVTDSQVASVHGGSGSNDRSAHSHSPSVASDPHLPGQGQLSDVSSRSRYSHTGAESRRPEHEARSEASRDSRHGNAAPDTTTVSSNNPFSPETLVTESESGRFGLDFAFSFGGDDDSEYETRATTVSSGSGAGSSSGHEAVDLHAMMRRSTGQEFVGLDGLLRVPPMSAFGQSGWSEQMDADLGRV